jgi:CheY-like chemotaxis protein
MTTAATGAGAYMEPRSKAILCLCHDSNMLEIRRMLLEHFGYRVFPADSVENAKQAAQSNCPDMLLLDNSYPGISFEQVAEQVKQVCPQLIAVVLSPYYQRGPHGLSAIDCFVDKDDGPDVLVSQIAELFDQGPPRDRRKQRTM